MSVSTPVAIDALTKDNYNTWRMQAEAFLEVCDLWDHVAENKEIMSRDADRRELWMRKDKLAKSKLILHISSELLPLVEDCKTSREVWLKLANVYGIKGGKHEDSIGNLDTDDEDAIINDIESSVDDLFEIINKSPLKITEKKNTLTAMFVDNLFTRLKESGIKKLPDKEIIAGAISDYIDVIDKLSKTGLKNRTNELNGELVDILLVKFDIDPHKNYSDEAKSNADGAEARDNDIDGDGKKENNGVSNKLDSIGARDVAENQREAIPGNEGATEDGSNEIIGIYKKLLQSKQQYDNERISAYELYRQEGCANTMSPLRYQYTPPPTPFPKKTYKCGVCREEGHNRTRCPLNKTAVPAVKFAVKTTTIPKRSYKCGVCGDEAHNRTTCPLNKPAASALKSTARNSETPRRAYKCGICGDEGHNRTTCPLNKPAASASKYTAGTTEAPKRSYKCGGCGNEGHNISSCPSMKSRISLPKPAAITTPVRSYTCGLCGGEGHNRASCMRTFVTPTASARATPRCSTCGGEGHNSRTCGRRETSSSSSYYTPSYSSYSSLAPSYSGGGRSYSCGNCGGAGHNRRTCSN